MRKKQQQVDRQTGIHTDTRTCLCLSTLSSYTEEKEKKKANKTTTTTTTETDLVKTIPDLIHFPLRYQSPLLLHCCPKCTACIHLFKSLASPSPFVTTVQQHPPIPRQASSSSPRLTCLYLPYLPRLRCSCRLSHLIVAASEPFFLCFFNRSV